MKNKKIIWYLLAFVTLIFLSVHWVWWRFLTADEGLSPFLVVFLRFFLWFLFLVIFMPIFTKKKDFTKLFNWKNKLLNNKNFWLSAIFFFINLITFVYALKYTSASNTILIESMSPIIVLLITLVYYPNISSNYNFRKIFFITVIASIGSSLLVSDNSLLNNSIWNNKIFWDIMAFITMIFFALFSFFYVELRKDFDKANWLIITSAFLLVWAILSLPALIIYYDSLFNLSQTAINFIFLISFGSTWLAYFTWFLAWRYLTAITLILIFNIVGLTTMIFEYFFYWQTQNEITYKLYLWAVLIIGSIYYINYLTSNKKIKLK